MVLNNLILKNFRSYLSSEFVFGTKTLIIGKNGAGKSNILEAIYLLATGKSFRAERDFEMISYDQTFSTIQTDGLKVIMEDRKKFEVNGIPRRLVDFAGNLQAVLFSPQDMELVTGSPGIRRRYLDFVISQKDREYRRCLISYEKGLRQRNKLLELIRDNLASRSQLFFWDKLLIKNGNYMTNKRAEFLQATGFSYDKSEISESRLKQYEIEEIASATTLVGPQRDDFIFIQDAKDLSKYGSRGQQRMAVWWLKQCEIAYLGGVPILLLDDIFSELDQAHRLEVEKLVERYGGQVIMTTAEEESSLGLDISRVITVRLP